MVRELGASRKAGLTYIHFDTSGRKEAKRLT